MRDGFLEFAEIQSRTLQVFLHRGHEETARDGGARNGVDVHGLMIEDLFLEHCDGSLAGARGFAVVHENVLDLAVLYDHVHRHWSVVRRDGFGIDLIGCRLRGAREAQSRNGEGNGCEVFEKHGQPPSFVGYLRKSSPTVLFGDFG